MQYPEFISCIIRQDFYASRGETRVRAVLTTRSAPEEKLFPFSPLKRAHISSETDTIVTL